MSENNKEVVAPATDSMETINWDQLGLDQLKLLTVLISYVTTLAKKIDAIQEIATDVSRKITLLSLAGGNENDLIKTAIDKIFDEAEVKKDDK
jgi:hypothetical protein